MTKRDVSNTRTARDRTSSADNVSIPARNGDGFHMVSRLDLGAMAVLAMSCLLAWCAANAKWTSHAWGLPTTYVHDPERGDFFANAAVMKAAHNWYGAPFLWKNVAELGAPYDGNWNDFPSLDEVVLTLQVFLTRILGLYAGLNMSFVLAHVFAAVAFYVAARFSCVNVTWSFIGGLAFGIAPFIFAQSPHHMQVAYVWPIALFPLVWKAVSSAPGLTWGTKPWWLAVAAGFITGLHCVYYTNVFCQLTLIGATIRWLRTRDNAAFRAAVAVIGAAALGFALNNVDGWTYRMFHEPNHGAFVREYKWLEIYGLKLVDLVIPPVTHRFEPVRAFAMAHRVGNPAQGIPPAAQLLDEGGSYLGVLGLLALGWIVWDALKAAVRGQFDEVPIEVWWILWIVLMFTTGGLNAILGAAGITMFRAACRYAVVILAISLLYAARRITTAQSKAAAHNTDGTAGILWGTLATMLSMVCLYDQIPRAPAAEYANATAVLVDSDRRFVAEMEAALPEGAMVFQFPVVDYPESPVPGLGSYEHFRPYLYSSKLRFSFGSHKGREREVWQQVLMEKLFDIDKQTRLVRSFRAENADTAINELKDRGFKAVYINRRGLPDGGRSLEEALRETGNNLPLIRSRAGDLDCIPLGN